MGDVQRTIKIKSKEQGRSQAVRSPPANAARWMQLDALPCACRVVDACEKKARRRPEGHRRVVK
jgi:hypothetical protein